MSFQRMNLHCQLKAIVARANEIGRLLQNCEGKADDLSHAEAAALLDALTAVRERMTILEEKVEAPDSKLHEWPVN